MKVVWHVRGFDLLWRHTEKEALEAPVVDEKYLIHTVLGIGAPPPKSCSRGFHNYQTQDLKATYHMAMSNRAHGSLNPKP